MRRKAFLFSLFGLLVILCLAVPALANAASIGISAPPTVNINDEFAVNVVVNDVTDLAGVRFIMSYNSDILQVQSKSNIVSGMPDNVPKLSVSISDPGLIDYVGLNMDSPATCFTGSGTAAVITFKAVGAGSSELKITSSQLAYWHENEEQGNILHTVLPPVTVNVISGEVTPPTVTTGSATGISTSGATLNGNITNTGGKNCDQRKFQYRQQGTTTWKDAGPESGSFEIGPFSFTLIGLTQNTTYEFKAMARNSAGWGEGSVKTFTTESGGEVTLPAVTTGSATGISTSGATLNGDITNTGGETCDQRKFQYRQQGTTTWIDDGLESGSFGTGPFSFALDGLAQNTTYEFKAMAQNSAGWGEGSVLTFTTETEGLNIDINLSPAQDISFTRPLQITGTATGTGADNVSWLVEIRDGGIIASFTPANGPGFTCVYTPVKNLPVVGDYSVRVVATPEAGTPVEKIVPFNIYNYPLKITDLTVTDSGATRTLSATVTNLENSSQPVVGICQVTGPDESVVFLEIANQITIDASGSQTITFTFNTPQAAGTYKAELFIWLLGDVIRTVGTPEDTTFTI